MSLDGIKLYKDVNNILIENCTVYDVGEHGIHVYNQQSVPYTITSGVRIINNTIYNAPHNLIDFHTRISNSVVEGNELYFSDDYSGVKQVGLYLHNGDTDSITISDNNFHDQPRPLEILNANTITVTNNTFTDIDGRAIMLGDAGSVYESNHFGVYNSTFENNTLDNTSGILFWASTSANFSNITFTNNTFTDIVTYFSWFYENTILDNVSFVDVLPRAGANKGSRLIDIHASASQTNVYYNDTQNTVINTTGIYITKYYPTYSTVQINSTIDITISSHNMTFIPNTGYGHTVSVNTDLVNDISNITGNVSADGTVVTMDFIVDNVTNTYNLSVNGVYNTSAVSNSNSVVSFDYAFSSALSTDFEVTWASAEGWTPETNHIYFGRRFSVTRLGITQIDTPQQEDIDLTNVVSVVVS